MIAAIVRLLSIPILLLNFGGGIAGAVWLVILSQWAVLGIGIAATILSWFALGLLLAPNLLFSRLSAAALDRGSYTAGVIWVLVCNLWSSAVMTAWCAGCFAALAGTYNGNGSLWPYLLWAYGVATGPWIYMAAAEGQELPAPFVSAFGACAGAIAIMGMFVLKAHPSLAEIAIAFCVPIATVLIYQASMSFAAMSGQTRPGAVRQQA